MRHVPQPTNNGERLMQKSVLSEDELIQLMRQSRGDYEAEQPGSAVGGSRNVYFSTGDDVDSDMRTNRRMLNVVWTTYQD